MECLRWSEDTKCPFDQSFRNDLPFLVRKCDQHSKLSKMIDDCYLTRSIETRWNGRSTGRWHVDSLARQCDNLRNRHAWQSWHQVLMSWYNVGHQNLSRILPNVGLQARCPPNMAWSWHAWSTMGIQTLGITSWSRNELIFTKMSREIRPI